MKKLFLLLLTSSWALASQCPNADLREAKIGGDAISGHVEAKRQPVKSVAVRLYMGRNLVWRGTTDSNGAFEINRLQHGQYRLVVSRWGSATIELKSELSQTGLHQQPVFNLTLSDRECLSTVMVVN
jgi:hypothetical protein